MLIAVFSNSVLFVSSRPLTGQQSYDELERCAQAKARMEETMRRSLEMQLLQLLDARSKVRA
jgi:hypothetical protein